MKLLLAEDEYELSRALTMILKHSHYLVDAVYNGTDALAYLESESYDGVIMDIMMPGMDGISVLKEIRQQGNDVPVLLLTAKTEVDDRVLGLDCGADDYLGKPFAMKELLARIRAMTRRKGGMAAAGSSLAFGDLMLEQSVCELSCGDAHWHLSNKEYQIMELLMANPGQKISADRFLSRIWDVDSETDASVIWVYISNLRKHLLAIGSRVQIRAARNQGYYLEDEEK